MKCKVVYPKLKTNKLSIISENGYYHLIITDSDDDFDYHRRLSWISKKAIGKIVEINPTPIKFFCDDDYNDYNIYYEYINETVIDNSVVYPSFINKLFLEKNLSFMKNE